MPTPGLKYLATLPLGAALVAVLLLNTSVVASNRSADSLEKSKKELENYLLHHAPRASYITKLVEQQKPDGTWPEIDYNDRARSTWSTARHVYNLDIMARAFRSPKSKLQNHPELKQAILRGIDHWNKKQYRCPNWWYNDIGCPMRLANTVFLMEEDLSEAQLAESISYIKRAKFGRTAQNSVWTAGITFVRAMIEDAPTLANQSRDVILKDLKITTAEGLQPDYSFHQHGPQQQFGNYGSQFIGDMIRWGLIWQGTDLALSEYQIELLRNYILEGLSLAFYKGQLDISACGRQFSPGRRRKSAKGFAIFCKQMAQLDPENATRYEAAIQDSRKKPKYFWRSDYAVHHDDHYMTTVRMSSTRTIGAETCNSENMKGYFLGDGANYVYVEGDEYDNIFPVWDWRHLPGVTCLQNKKQSLVPERGYTNAGNFVGGLEAKTTIASDGNTSFQPGIATLDYQRDGVRAKKSWFFFDGAIACLGTGITSEESYPVHTTINQCHLDGPVYVWINGVRAEHPAGKLAVYQNVNALWHDNVLYRFPKPTTVNLSTRKQTGNWQFLKPALSTDPVHQPIFLAWIDHGTKPQNASSSYVTIPNHKPELTDAKSDPTALVIVANTADLQQVTTQDGSQLAVAIYKPTNLNVPTGSRVAIDRPCVLTSNRFQASIADPTQTLEQITLKSEESTQTVKLPQSGMAGSRSAPILWCKEKKREEETTAVASHRGSSQKNRENATTAL